MCGSGGNTPQVHKTMRQKNLEHGIGAEMLTVDSKGNKEKCKQSMPHGKGRNLQLGMNMWHIKTS